MSKKLAVFDIDGTLFRWQLFHELVFEIKNQGLLPIHEAHKLDQAFIDWRALKASWSDYEEKVVEAIQNNIKNINPDKFESAAQAVFNKSGHKVYNYTSKLAKQLKSDGYFLLAITGSQQEIAELFAKKYGFDECIGAVHRRTADGKFDGSYERFVVDKKGKLLSEFAEANGFAFKDSYAIGDSSGDIEMLELVDHPIAFNPNETLLKTAMQKGWPVVIERKNISYMLTKGKDEYELADTTIHQTII
jgi:HAD superfamily hydrolase (TIGR01490 family)